VGRVERTSSPSRSNTFTALRRESSIGVLLDGVSNGSEKKRKTYSSELSSCAVGEAGNLFEKELALQEMGDPRKWRVNEAGLNEPDESPV
jgi:hypothetical protein